MKGIRLDLENEALSIRICICREFKRHGYPQKLVQQLPVVVLFRDPENVVISNVPHGDKVLAL